MRAFALAVAVCLALIASPSAQKGTGTLAGVIRDAAGLALPGVTVTLTPRREAPGNALQKPLTAVTDVKGAFKFDNVPLGVYDLTATLTGFSRITRRVTVNETSTPVSITLRPAAVSEQVAVAKASPAPVTFAGRITAGVAGGVVGGVVGGVPQALPPPPGFRGGREFNTEAYDRIEDNPFRLVSQDPLSTFSIDVDTASYANVRRFLNTGALPPPDAVRIEELINYFRFEYPQPSAPVPFSVTTELAPCPWNDKHRLALIGLQAKALTTGLMPARNLVFLLDVSGSMMPADKLPLVKTAMRMLVDTLTERDRIAIVVYAGASGVVLPSTTGDHKDRIHEAIARLELAEALKRQTSTK